MIRKAQFFLNKNHRFTEDRVWHNKKEPVSKQIKKGENFDFERYMLYR